MSLSMSFRWIQSNFSFRRKQWSDFILKYDFIVWWWFKQYFHIFRLIFYNWNACYITLLDSFPTYKLKDLWDILIFHNSFVDLNTSIFKKAFQTFILQSFSIFFGIFEHSIKVSVFYFHFRLSKNFFALFLKFFYTFIQ